MWSDRPSPERLAALIEKLHSVLPAPSPTATSTRVSLQGHASPAQLAELLGNELRAEPGFAYLNRRTNSNDEAFAPCLLHNPLATISYSTAANSGIISGPAGTVKVPGPGLDILEAVLAAWHGPENALLAGFISYDLAVEIEDLGMQPPPDFQFPALYFALFDSALIFDEGAWTLSGTDAWRGQNGLPVAPSEAEDLLERAAKIKRKEPAIAAHALTSKPDRPSFEDAVRRIVNAIHAGDIFQTNLCRRIESDVNSASDWDIFERMRTINPSRYEAFFRVGEGNSILSVSPEMFLKLDSGIVVSSPIKGTRPRGTSVAKDEQLSTELLASEKDRAELAMIVDVVRNDLSRVCHAGSVQVTGHATLMSLPTVHHLFSTIEGHLRPGSGIVELLRATFPAASITGAPKIEAMRIAMREEGQLRGPCMGAIGWISMDGRTELSVAIRTAFVSADRVRYYAGCGITSDSVPATEFIESRHKAAAFVHTLGLEHDPHR